MRFSGGAGRRASAGWEIRSRGGGSKRSFPTGLDYKNLKGIGAMFGLFTKDIGIDLGTANTLVFRKGKGIIMREPSVVAVDTRTDTVRYVGQEAKEVIGRTPGSIVAVRPDRKSVG